MHVADRSVAFPRWKGTAELAVVILITLAGAGLRLLLWSTQSIVSVDGTAFIRMARAMSGGPAFASVHAYGYPALILLTRPFAGDWVLAARSVDFVFGVALIPLVWLAARPWIGRAPLRCLPAAATAFLPLPVRYSLTTMTEAPYLALIVLALALVGRRRWFAVGLATGAAYTVRPEALVVAAALAVLRWRRPREAARVLVGAAMIVAVYVTAVGLHDGVWTLSRKTINLSAATWRDAEERAGEAAVPSSLAGRWRRFGAESLAEYPERGWATLRQLAVQSGVTPLVIAPLGISAATLPLVSGLAPLVALPFTFVGARPRFMLPYLPVLWLLAVAALDRKRGRMLVAGTTLLLAGAIAGAIHERALYTQNEDGDFPELVAAGRWLAAVAGPDVLVVDRKPYVAFYAGARLRYPPTGSCDAVVDAVIAEGGDFLVVNDWVARRYRAELLPLVGDPDTVARETRLAPIYVDRSDRGMLTVIYRVVRPGGPPPFPAEGTIREGLVRLLASMRRDGTATAPP